MNVRFNNTLFNFFYFSSWSTSPLCIQITKLANKNEQVKLAFEMERKNVLKPTSPQVL